MVNFTTYDKTVLAIFLEWDYGVKSRGESLEKASFLPALSALVRSVEVLWIDQLLHDPKKLREALLEAAQRIRPDLIVCIPLREEISPQTFAELRQNFTVYAWFGDDQWRFDEYTSRFAPCFTHVSTTDPWSVARYRRLGIEPILTQWAAQPFSSHVGPLQPGEEYRYDVSFVGGANRYRRWFIEQLKRRGIVVECFGAGWPNGRVSYQQIEQIFRKSRINLNISNSVNNDIRFIFGSPYNFLSYVRSEKRVEQMKARNFEINVAGGFQLTNYVAGLERYFHIGQQVAIYTTPEDCCKQIEYYLDDAAGREAIATDGYRYAVANHTYMNRFDTILKKIWSK